MIFPKFIKTSLFRDTGLYAATNLMNAVLPLLLLPVLTWYLSSEDYGIVAMLGIAISILNVCVDMNSDLSMINSTDMGDNDFHKALLEANTKLV